MPSERALARTLEVSRVVIKQALMILEQSGFVEIKPGSRGGAIVTNNFYKPVSNFFVDLFKDGSLTLNHFYEARKAIEMSSIKLAVEKITDEDIQELENLNKKMIQDIRDRGRYRENNMAFHLKIAEISGNPLIMSIVQSLLELLNTVWDTQNPGVFQPTVFDKSTYERHEQIIEALKNRDVETCSQLITIDTEYTKNLTPK